MILKGMELDESEVDLNSEDADRLQTDIHDYLGQADVLGTQVILVLGLGKYQTGFGKFSKF